ncbi:phosphate signaling complex protein PhoU [Halotalea alkalilenta]|uniref:Phosphate-specific transport system accessory protein PhoU n=1 Tax=Halotalea alkalilenta TaxID=376489 RepID=A0A172YBL1_9GAMM|nr:phosphate signaling complex protein PhoU [Halotalea alkalilenta]ANF56395.1 transcriptional regulator PhoU [Halotalea alkalilenta]
MDISSEQHSQHISRQFNQELEGLKTHLMAMGGLVEKQILDALTALLDGNGELAEEVRRFDHEVNEMQLQLDDECTHILARRQPAASDLRLVLAVIRAASDLERMGDEADKIARHALALMGGQHNDRGFVEIRRVGAMVRDMVRNALTAFARFDTKLALEVRRADTEVDNEYKSALRSLVTFMMEDPASISGVLDVLWVLRALERIGDHADNLAESVIYLVKGLDLRHTHLRDLDEKDLDDIG